jgi:hypothetical protein
VQRVGDSAVDAAHRVGARGRTVKLAETVLVQLGHTTLASTLDLRSAETVRSSAQARRLPVRPLALPKRNRVTAAQLVQVTSAAAVRSAATYATPATTWCRWNASKSLPEGSTVYNGFPASAELGLRWPRWNGRPFCTTQCVSEHAWMYQSMHACTCIRACTQVSEHACMYPRFRACSRHTQSTGASPVAHGEMWSAMACGCA